MSKDTMATFNEYTQNVLDNLRELNDINLRTWEKLMERQLKMSSSYVEMGAKNLDNLAKAKDYQEAMSQQAQMVQDFGNQWVDATREMSEIFNQSFKDMNTLVEKGLGQFRDSAKTA